jgi:hypothetical protein
MSAGKGDKPRPVDKKIYDKNFDNIKWDNGKNSKDCKIVKKNNKTKYSY